MICRLWLDLYFKCRIVCITNFVTLHLLTCIVAEKVVVLARQILRKPAFADTLLQNRSKSAWGDLRAHWTLSSTCAACANWEDIRCRRGSPLGKSKFLNWSPSLQLQLDSPSQACNPRRVCKLDLIAIIFLVQFGRSPVTRQCEIHAP